MSKEELVLISKWLTEKVVYLLVLFFVFVGLMFSIAMNQARELRLPVAPASLPFLLTFVIHGCSFALMATVMAFAIESLHWNTWLMCFFGGFMGMGANTLSNWLLTVWTSSEKPTDFFHELARWFGAFWTAFRAAKGGNNNNANPPT